MCVKLIGLRLFDEAVISVNKLVSGDPLSNANRSSRLDLCLYCSLRDLLLPNVRRPRTVSYSMSAPHTIERCADVTVCVM